MSLLKSLLEIEVFKPSQDTFDAQAIHDKLDRSAIDDEVETITFGLETDDDEIVKVYVKVEDADEFEKALGVALGEYDDIESSINQLSTEFDIVNVQWPDSDEDEDVKKSDSLNDKVNYDDVDDFFAEPEVDMSESVKVESSERKTIGQRWKERVLEKDLPDEAVNIEEPEVDHEQEFDNFDTDDFDHSADDTSVDVKSVLSRAVTFYQELSVIILLKMGLGIKDLDFLMKKDPTLVRHLGDTMKEMDAGQRRVVIRAFGINTGIPDEAEEEDK